MIGGGSIGVRISAHSIDIPRVCHWPDLPSPNVREREFTQSGNFRSALGMHAEPHAKQQRTQAKG